MVRNYKITICKKKKTKRTHKQNNNKAKCKFIKIDSTFRIQKCTTVLGIDVKRRLRSWGRVEY